MSAIQLYCPLCGEAVTVLFSGEQCLLCGWESWVSGYVAISNPQNALLKQGSLVPALHSPIKMHETPIKVHYESALDTVDADRLEQFLIESFPELNCVYYRTPFFLNDNIASNGMAVAQHRFNLFQAMNWQKNHTYVVNLSEYAYEGIAKWDEYKSGKDIDPPVLHLLRLLQLRGYITDPLTVIT